MNNPTQPSGQDWLELLDLDHRRIRALLTLISEGLEAETSEPWEQAVIVMDLMTYMHEHVDPAHHGVEDLLFNAVKGADPGLDKIFTALEDQHKRAFSEGGSLLHKITDAFEKEDDQALLSALRHARSYCQRMLKHLAEEDDLVFPALSQHLAQLSQHQLPERSSDPIFDRLSEKNYRRLYQHYLHRVQDIDSRSSVLDILPMPLFVEVYGWISEQVATVRSHNKAYRKAQREGVIQHLSDFRQAALLDKQNVLKTAFVIESQRFKEHKKALFLEFSNETRGVVATGTGLVDYIKNHNRRTLKKIRRRKGASRI